MAAVDNFEGLRVGRESGARNAFAITPHDTNELAHVTRGIYVGVSGDLKVELVSGDIVTYVDLVAGVTHAKEIKLVYSTGTTATDIVGEY